MVNSETAAEVFLCVKHATCAVKNDYEPQANFVDEDITGQLFSQEASTCELSRHKGQEDAACDLSE